jgi:AraC-like DNA-binding protein
MPYRVDLFALFIFLGIVQAFFLAFFFLSKENRSVKANLFHGIMLISIAFCVLEIFLNYTGYITKWLFLVDFSETFSFLIGPAFYLMIVSLTRGEVSRRKYLHFLFAPVYLLLQLPFLLASNEVKYHAYMHSYYPDFPHPHNFGETRWFWVTDHHTEATLISLALYALLGLYEVVRAFRIKKESFWKPVSVTLQTLRAGLLQLVTFFALIVLVKIFNKNDTGDHLFAAYLTIPVYLTSFRVIRQSGFFKQANITEQLKYKSSTLTEEQQKTTLEKLKSLMETEKPFLQSDFSLPQLADRLKLSVHIVSQVINDGLGKSFFEMTAEYRVATAKQLLKDQPNIKIEEIAEQVGYNSKSSFNTAFKKITGKTPSEFRQ